MSYQTIENTSDNDTDIEGKASIENCINEQKTSSSENTQKSTSCHAAWNLFNMVEGTGVLGLPYAVKQGGFVVIIGLALLAVISNYTGQILISCLYEKEAKVENEKDENGKDVEIRVRSTYEDIGRACFPRFGGKVVIVVQIVELVFVSTLYLVLSGSLLIHVFPNYSISRRGWIAISALVVLPTVFLQHLSHVAWLSLISSLALLTTLTGVTIFSIHVSEQWDIDKLDNCNIETLPVGVGIVLFSYAAHPLLPGIEESLQNRSKFSLVMNLTFFLVALTKIVFSITSYLSFSDKTQEVITNNLPGGFYRSVGCILLVINVLFSYAFPMFTVICCITTSVVTQYPTLIESNYLGPFLTFLRLILVLITLLAALLIPHFALLMSFIGNLTGTFLVFIFPPLFYMMLHKGQLPLWQMLLNVGIILFGIGAGIVGIYASGIALVKAYISD